MNLNTNTLPAANIQPATQPASSEVLQLGRPMGSGMGGIGQQIPEIGSTARAAADREQYDRDMAAKKTSGVKSSFGGFLNEHSAVQPVAPVQAGEQKPAV